MAVGLIGKKLGMTQIFGANGNVIPITVVQAGPCVVVQKKTTKSDGYDSLQVGFNEVKKAKLVNKPRAGHFKKANVAPQAKLVEFRISPDEQENYKVGTEILVDFFEPGDFVDVSGVSIGKGFAGVMKRHGFHGAPAAHGSHEVFRHGGSLGANMTPAHVLKGRKMAGQMGSKNVTVQNLKIVGVRGDMNLVLIEGAVPGHRNGYVVIKKAVKKP